MVYIIVAVVGATFAYFTATSTNPEEGKGSATIQTAKVDNIKLNATAMEQSNNKPIYPGTMNYVGTSVSASIDGASGSGKNYDVTFKITGKIEVKTTDHEPAASTLAQDVTWTAYKVTKAEKTALSDKQVVSCDPVTPVSDGVTVKYSQSCKTDETITTEVGSGTLSAGSGSETIEITDQKVTTGADEVYYYIVYQYKNVESPQNEDQGKNIIVSIDAIEGTKTEEAVG